MANVFLGSVYANLELRDAGWTTGIAAAQRNISNFNRTTSDAAGGSETFSKRFAVAMGVISGIASNVVSRSINTIKDSVDSAVRRVDTLHASARTFQYMGFSSQAASRATEALKASILGLPTPLDQAMRGMTALAATYGDVELGQKMFTALNNAVLGFGGTAAMAENAIAQLSQLPMDGPLDAQTWMSLRNSGLTPVLVAMSKDMGMSVSQLKTAFGEGKLKVSDFVNELIKMDKQGGGGLASLASIAKNATGGISTSMENAKTAVARGLASIIDAIGQGNIANSISQSGKRMENALNMVAKAVPPVLNAFNGLMNFISQNRTVIELLVVAVASSIAAWKAYQVAMFIVKKATLANAAINKYLYTIMYLQTKGVSLSRAAWLALNTTMKANLIGLIVQGIMVLIGVLTYLQLKFNIFGKAFEALKPVFSAVGSFFADVFRKIGGVATSIFNGVADFFKKWGKTIAIVFGVIFAPIAAPIAAIILLVKNWQTVMTVVGGAISSVLKPIGSAFSAVAGVVVGVVGAIIRVVSRVASIIASVVGTIVGVIVKVISTVITILTPVIQIVDLIIHAIVGLGQIIWTIFSGIVQVVVTVVSTLVQIIGVVLYGTLMNIWNNVFVPFGTAIAYIFTHLGEVVTMVGSIIGTVMTTIFSVISTVWNAIMSVVMPILSTIFNVVSSVFNGVLSVISSIMNAVWSVISAIWGAVLPFIQPILNVMSAVIGSVFRGISAVVSSVMNAVRNYIIQPVAAAVSYVVNTVGQIATAIGNAVRNAYNAVTGFVGNFTSAGKNIIDGIVKGVASAKDAVVNKIKEICSGALDAVKHFFGIKSPSRVMMKMFGYVVEGGVRGLHNNAGMLQDAFKSTFNMLPDLVAEPTIGATVNYGARAANAMTPDSVNPGGGSQTNIYGDIHVDSKNDDETILEELDRGVVLSGKGMTTEV
nr:MAG TPA: tail tape measure [Caudoviricetes sp.]